jgi:hypothetical protein
LQVYKSVLSGSFRRLSGAAGVYNPVRSFGNHTHKNGSLHLFYLFSSCLILWVVLRFSVWLAGKVKVLDS